MYWWWSSVKVLGQDNRENGEEALINYVWLRYKICLCLEIHVSDNLSGLKNIRFVLSLACGDFCPLLALISNSNLGPRLGLTKYQACSGSKLLDTGKITEKNVLKVLFKKKSAGNKKEAPITQNAKSKRID